MTMKLNVDMSKCPVGALEGVFKANKSAKVFEKRAKSVVSCVIVFEFHLMIFQNAL